MLWETRIPVNQVFELRCKTTDYFGVGAINKIDEILDVLKKRNITKVLIITDKTVYKVTGVWDKLKPALDSKGFTYEVYEGVVPNPTTENVDEATKKGLEIGADAVIGIGGGSHIDTAKSVAILLDYPDKNAKELYELKFTPTKAKPIIAINTTHGTGTEVNRFAVVSILEKNYKPAIAYDVIYPLYSIDDPELTKTLPPNQTRYTAIDALNHVTEAVTTKAATPYSIELGIEAARLIFKYLPAALENPSDLQARYYLLYASAIAGISFDNGLLHLTHALEHPLSAVKPDLPHGLGLAMLLPAVIKSIYPAKPEPLAEMYKPIAPELKGVPGEAEYLAKKVEEWLYNMGVTEKLTDVGFTEKDVEKLTELAMTTPSLDILLQQSPIGYNKDIIKKIYLESLYPYNK